MIEKKISPLQLVILLLLCRLSSLLTAPAGAGLFELSSILLSSLFQFLLLLPVLFLARKEGTEPVGIAVHTVGKLGYLYGGGLALYFLVVAAFSLFDLSRFLSDAIYPGISRLLLALILLLAIAYGAHLGLEAITRSALPIFVLFLLMLIFTFFGVSGEIGLINLRPFEASPQSLIRNAFTRAISSPELPLLALLLPQAAVNRKSVSLSLGFLSLSTLFLELAAFLTATVFGTLSDYMKYPLYNVGTLAKLSIFQRLDAVYVAIWILAAFIKGSILLWIAYQLLLPLTGKKKKITLPLSAILLYLGIAFAVPTITTLLQNGIPLLILLVLIPVILIPIAAIRRKEKKTND